MDRVERAAALLQRYRPGTYAYLGAGFAGVVFHDEAWVYKVHVPITDGGYGEQGHLPYLAAKLGAFQGARHLYALRELVCHEGTYILVYPYEASEPATEASEDEWCSYLAELWERRLITRSVKLATNFRRAAGVLKLIDYEIEPYDDNLFLNVAVRAFIQLPHVRDRVTSAAKLQRASINRFDLPELAGFFDFVAKVGDTIAARARRSAWGRRRMDAREQVERLDDVAGLEAMLGSAAGAVAVSLPLDAVDPRRVAFIALRRGHRLRSARIEPPPVAGEREGAPRVRLDLPPLCDPPQPVTLLIKACAQDAEILEHAVTHVVLGMSGPERFAERVLALDVTPRTQFVRQFTSTGTVPDLLAAANRLVASGVVDRIVLSPADEEEIRSVNRQWFGLDAAQTHTRQGVPVVPQLHAFDAVHTDAILQVDIDALVGVRDPDHLVLADMLRAFDDARVVSVAFPICRPADEGFQPYFGFEGGGFVPEVRCCLLLRSRLRALRPLANGATADGLERTWYRAVETRQRELGRCSLRGGPGARFFIHPQNYRKAMPSTWPALIDRVEQGAIPLVQEGQPEVRGALRDWHLPARPEDTVVVAVIVGESPAQICRLLLDLETQSCRTFGVILVDASGRRLAGWIARVVGFDPARLTVVDRHDPVTKPAAVLEAVRAYVQRDDALVCLLDASDMLLGSNVIDELRNRTAVYGADALVGKELSAEGLPRAGKHARDLVAPRRQPEAFADGIRAVRRYLLDALDLRDVRIDRSAGIAANTFARLSRSHDWVDDPHLLALVVPAVELSRNPVCVDHFHVLRRRPPAASAPGAEVLGLLASRPARPEGAYTRGRKAFAPNLRRIELDITYDCNLKCQACNRSCTQAPTREHMDLEQVRAFVRDSIALDHRWEVINVLGGEPTLHPDFHEIVRVLVRDYVDAFSHETVVQVTSNGFGAVVRRRLDELPPHPRLVINRESFKDGPRVPYFTPFNDAPVDDPALADAEYAKGCWVTSYCGIGLNHLGYFPCAVAGGIERLLGAGRAVASLAEVDATIAASLDTYCRLCGNFKHYDRSRGDFVPRSEKDVCEEPRESPTWTKLYAIRRRSDG